MSDFGKHEKRNSLWSVVLGIRFCLTEISAMGYLTGTSTNRFIVIAMICNAADIRNSVPSLCYSMQGLIEFPLDAVIESLCRHCSMQVSLLLFSATIFIS